MHTQRDRTKRQSAVAPGKLTTDISTKRVKGKSERGGEKGKQIAQHVQEDKREDDKNEDEVATKKAEATTLQRRRRTQTRLNVQ